MPSSTRQAKCRASIMALMMLVLTSAVIAACAPPPPQSPAVTPPPTLTRTPLFTETAAPNLVATVFVSELIGKLAIVDGCVRVIDRVDNASRLLVWPPDFEVTIEKDTVRAICGKVSGNRTEALLHDGAWVRLSGGETSQPDEQLLSSEPPDCPGPYWVVGFEVGPYPAINETTPP